MVAASFGQATYIDRHDFGRNGDTTYGPYVGLSFDANGDVYGVTTAGGPNSTNGSGAGSVWEVEATGTYRVLHYFGGTVTNADGASGPDGNGSQSPVLIDDGGNLFGAAAGGGPYGGGGIPGYGDGMIWEITSAGVYKDLHDFGGTVTNANGSSGPDGVFPAGPVYKDTAGNLYGIAYAGGPYDNDGEIWEISSTGLYKDLHEFGGTVTNEDGASGPDGTAPRGALYLDASGDVFGVTVSGGPHYSTSIIDSGGVIWEITAARTYRDLHDFGGSVTNADGVSGPDGECPTVLIADSGGNLYGATSNGGPYGGGGVTGYGDGNLWELTTSGTYKDLHDFGGTIINANGTSGTDGADAQSLVFDGFGNLYGTTNDLGPFGKAGNYGGLLWEFTVNGTYKDLHDFGGTTTNADGKSGPDGQNPYGPIAIDSAGNLFGVDYYGGSTSTGQSNGGMIWEVTTAGQYLDLHDFGGFVTLSNGSQGQDAVGPEGVALDPSGNLYGACGTNTNDKVGNLWEIRRQGIVSLTLSPTAMGGLGTSIGTVTIGAPAPVGGWKVNLMAGAAGYLNLPSSVTVAEGATTATFTITGTAQRSSTVDIGIIATAPYSYIESILTIQGDEVNGLSFSPSTIGGSGSTTATVTLSSAAPPGGWIVNLSAGASGYLNMPASVTVPAGATSTTFTITGANQRTGNAKIGVIASDDNASVESILTVEGDALAGITLSPTTIGWSGTSTGTVTLVSAAPEGGWVVNLKAGAPGYLSMPASVTVPAGATTATFSVTGASQRSESATIGVIANDTGNQVEADLTLTGDSLTGVSVSPTSVAPGSGSTGTVTLSSPAPVGGWVVKLFSGAQTDVGVPATVTVPAGATSATFSITTPTNAVPSKYGVFANDGTAQFETFLTIT